MTGQSRVLISFLGKGKYEKIVYKIDGKEYESELSIYPIKEEFKPDKIYVIGTSESSWDLLRDFQYERIIIPYGRSAEEFWEIIDILIEGLELKNSEVAFDITHCFRSIPFFVVIFIKFLKYISENTLINHIYYGILESKQIIDLRPMVDLLEWLDALSSFKKTGDLDGFCAMMDRAERDIKKQFKDKVELRLRKLKKSLTDLSAIAKMTYVPQLDEISRSLFGLIIDPEIEGEAKVYLKPLSLLLPEIKNMLEKFRAETVWQAQLKIARWYLENNKPSQAVLVLREAVVSYQCCKNGYDPYEKEYRDRVENEMSLQRMHSKDPLIKFWNRVIDTRNNVAHVLMKKMVKNIDPERAVKTVANLIEEAEKILL